MTKLFPLNHTTHISLTNLLESVTPSEKPIACHLKSVLEKNGAKLGKLISLPSITALSTTFKVSHIQVHDAFQHLREHGYDYFLKDMNAPITFWYTPVCDESSNCRNNQNCAAS